MAEGETPGPIPNPEAKPSSADGTAPGRVWESRSPPTIQQDGTKAATPHFSPFASPGNLNVGSHAPVTPEAGLRLVRPRSPSKPRVADSGPRTVRRSVGDLVTLSIVGGCRPSASPVHRFRRTWCLRRDARPHRERGERNVRDPCRRRQRGHARQPRAERRNASSRTSVSPQRAPLRPRSGWTTATRCTSRSDAGATRPERHGVAREGRPGHGHRPLYTRNYEHEGQAAQAPRSRRSRGRRPGALHRVHCHPDRRSRADGLAATTTATAGMRERSTPASGPSPARTSLRSERGRTAPPPWWARYRATRA